MAQVIEFYVPKNLWSPFVRAAPPQPGKVMEFCSETKKSVPTQPAGGIFGWLLAVTESDLAILPWGLSSLDDRLDLRLLKEERRYVGNSNVH